MKGSLVENYKNLLTQLYDNFLEFQEKKVLEIINELIKSGVNAEKVLSVLQKALIDIGKMFEDEKYFVTELIYAGEIMKSCNFILEPIFKSKKKIYKGKIVIGTVFGDIHDVGKDILVMLLNSSGFEVIDLGVNVPPETFVKALKESNARVLALSSLLTMSFKSIEDTVCSLRDSGLREKVMIMVGGAPVTELVKEKTGCDFYGKDAFEGLKYALKVYGN